MVADESDRAVVKTLADLARGRCEVDGFLERSEAERWLGWTAANQREDSTL